MDKCFKSTEPRVSDQEGTLFALSFQIPHFSNTTATLARQQRSSSLQSTQGYNQNQTCREEAFILHEAGHMETNYMT